MTIEQMLMCAIGVLAGVVALLWRHFERSAARLEKKHDDCDADRLKLWAKIAQLEGMSCRVDGCPMRQPIEDHERTRSPFAKSE